MAAKTPWSTSDSDVVFIYRSSRGAPQRRTSVPPFQLLPCTPYYTSEMKTDFRKKKKEPSVYVFSEGLTHSEDGLFLLFDTDQRGGAAIVAIRQRQQRETPAASWAAWCRAVCGILIVCFAVDKMCSLMFNRSFIDPKKEVAPNSKVLCFCSLKTYFHTRREWRVNNSWLNGRNLLFRRLWCFPSLRKTLHHRRRPPVGCCRVSPPSMGTS